MEHDVARVEWGLCDDAAAVLEVEIPLNTLSLLSEHENIF